MTSSTSRSRKILDLIQIEDNIIPTQNVDVQTICCDATKEPENVTNIIPTQSADVQTMICDASKEPENDTDIVSTQSGDVQMLCDVYNKPENQRHLNASEYFKHTEGRNKAVIDYRVSPVNSGESDADLSDGDPTFETVQKGQQGSHLLFPRTRSSSSSSSSSSTSDSSSSSDSSNEETLEEQLNANNTENRTPEPTRELDGGTMENQDNLTEDTTSGTPTVSTKPKGKKRTRQPENWKQTRAKKLRNCGKSYINSKNIITKARELKPPCNDQCRLQYSSKIDSVQRQSIFDAYWELGDIHNQRSFILSCLSDITPRYKYTNALTPRHCNKAFHFVVAGNSIRVCKTFFTNTLNISDRMIRTVKHKTDKHGILKTDCRGITGNHKSDEVLISDIKEFINSIPRTDSHYTRQSSTREYIDGGKTIVDLFKDFEEVQKQKNKPAGKYCTFYKVFNTQFNISFFRPRKDQCDTCLQYQNSSPEQKLIIQEKYDSHLEEKTLSRQEKYNDRLKIDDSNKVILFDLQAVLQSPKGDTSAFYYKSKLNSYNFTVASLNKKVEGKVQESYSNVHCYFWNETDAKRGANEIGSCLLHYFEQLCIESRATNEEGINLILYSDNCGGQNKNKYIVTLYLYAVTHLNINSITHKYLIKGHTQNEADNIHSLIEKEVKKNLRSGPIYSPHQYVSIIKNARKSGNKFIVNERTFHDFYDLKKLQEAWGYNFNKTKNGDNIVWNDVKLIKVTKKNPFSFFIKKSYKQDFLEVCVRNRRTKMLPLNELTLVKAYTGKQELSENKKKDLRELLSKNLIPNFYSDFYNSIL
ncbi:uncharacterized protein LOC124635622 isoform X3 [Helicoverpa zea]|nr:uncharacterized protein LOC124635622 isoform X3 [Helicoverpa zea]